MAVQTERICDWPDCRRPAEPVTVWRDGDMTGRAIDLCAEHLAPLMAAGTPVELPTKPRQKMEITSLRTTPRTAELKRRVTKEPRKRSRSRPPSAEA